MSEMTAKKVNNIINLLINLILVIFIIGNWLGGLEKEKL